MSRTEHIRNCWLEEEKIVPANVILCLRTLSIPVWLYLISLLVLTACGGVASAPPLTEVPTDTVTPEATASRSVPLTDELADAEGAEGVAPEATSISPETRDLHPSSYIDCERLAVHDSIFIQEISTSPIALRYYNLEMVTDSPYFMYCKGMAVFRTRRMPEGEPPRERLIMAQLIPKERYGDFLNARRDEPHLIGNIVPIEDVYISITSGFVSSGSK